MTASEADDAGRNAAARTLQRISQRSFRYEVIDTLDAAEAVHRAIQRETAATLGVDSDTYRRTAVCLSSAYEALARARQLLEGAA